MRGYETMNRVKPCHVKTSYESPCGVMSATCESDPESVRMLRIPMRGYEVIPLRYDGSFVFVTNPHAGL